MADVILHPDQEAKWAAILADLEYLASVTTTLARLDAQRRALGMPDAEWDALLAAGGGPEAVQAGLAAWTGGRVVPLPLRG